MKRYRLGGNKYVLLIVGIVAALVLIVYFVPIKSGEYPGNAPGCYEYGGKSRLSLVAGERAPKAVHVGPLTELCSQPGDPVPHYKLYIL